MFYAKTSDELFISKSTHGFKINNDRLPEYISQGVADDILFSGLCCRMLGSKGVSEDDVRAHVERIMACEPNESDYCYAWKSVEFSAAVSAWKSVVSRVLWETVVVGQGILDHLKV
jgi:hypothetical protein